MIKQIDFNSENDIKTVVALGYFDCLHIGHGKLLEKAKEIAENKGVDCLFFTFNNDVGKILGSGKKSVMTYAERLLKAERMGIDGVVSCEFDEKFKSLSALDFLNKLRDDLDPVHIVCGFDYSFGKNAEGKTELLKIYCESNSIGLTVVDEEKYEGKKISTTTVRELLVRGEIEKANFLLGEDYSLYGKVVKGRQVGRKLGFPTANVLFPEDKSPIKYGVYHTYAYIDGKRYDGITNYGDRPTFGLCDEVLTETYFDKFEGDLYGKYIEIRFVRYLRPIEKFDGIERLKQRLTKDLEIIKND